MLVCVGALDFHYIGSFRCLLCSKITRPLNKILQNFDRWMTTKMYARVQVVLKPASLRLERAMTATGIKQINLHNYLANSSDTYIKMSPSPSASSRCIYSVIRSVVMDISIEIPLLSRLTM